MTVWVGMAAGITGSELRDGAGTVPEKLAAAIDNAAIAPARPGINGIDIPFAVVYR
ncbi:hypothetical protein ACIBBG_34530 [Micromonospora chersina]|uniref:hypothetical protein n=1 Tax=Micromonospora chersina TaxID=47854 RepID=UPI00379AE10B